MISTPEYDALLAHYLDSYGIRSTTEQRTKLLDHLDLVVEKNRVMNLTRIVEPRSAVIRHVVDSLLLLPTIQKKAETTRFVDIGTGAGFPGIPLAVMTSMEGMLIDSVGKKVKAVNEFVEQLELSSRLTTKAIRAEDLARQERQSFDVVTARAVADLGILVEYAAPLLTMQGMLIVSKAHVEDDELGRGDQTARLVGLTCVSRETYELPEGEGHREILAYQRTKDSSVKLPRATGMAKSKPLAS